MVAVAPTTISALAAGVLNLAHMGALAFQTPTQTPAHLDNSFGVTQFLSGKAEDASTCCAPGKPAMQSPFLSTVKYSGMLMLGYLLQISASLWQPSAAKAKRLCLCIPSGTAGAVLLLTIM